MARGEEAERKSKAEEMKRKAEGMANFAIQVARLQVQVARVSGCPIVHQELQDFAKSRYPDWPQTSFEPPAVLDT